MFRFSLLLSSLLFPATVWAQTPAKPAKAAVDKRVALKFDGIGLPEVMQFFKDQSKVPIVIDPEITKSLENEEVQERLNRKFTVAVDDISLESGLALILESLRLTTIRRDEVLMITTWAGADKHLERRVYPVGDLLAGETPLISSLRQLDEVIQDTVHPQSWETMGGSGTSRPLAEVLVVAQSQAAHAELGQLLQTLRRVQTGKPRANNRYSAIRKALDATSAIDVTDKPLREVLAMLSEKHKIPIVLEPEITNVVVPSANLSGISLRSLLSIMLSPDLTFELRHEVLLITRREWAALHLEPQVYDVRDLVSEDGDAALSAADLLSTVTSTVAPDSWTARGGAGNARMLGGLLVVYQTQATHAQVQHLLDLLRTKLKQQ